MTWKIAHKMPGGTGNNNPWMRIFGPRLDIVHTKRDWEIRWNDEARFWFGTKRCGASLEVTPHNIGIGLDLHIDYGFSIHFHFLILHLNFWWHSKKWDIDIDTHACELNLDFNQKCFVCGKQL